MKRAKSRGDWVTASELARRMGVSRQRIHQLIVKGVIERRKDYLIHYPTAKASMEDWRSLDKNFWNYL